MTKRPPKDCRIRHCSVQYMAAPSGSSRVGYFVPERSLAPGFLNIAIHPVGWVRLIRFAVGSETAALRPRLGPHAMPAGSAAVVARKREQRRQEQAEAKAARATEKTAKIEAWFAAHDTDSNGSLDIAQFKSLLSSLYPGAPLNESTVNMLVDKCGGTISKQNVIAAVNKYGAVCGRARASHNRSRTMREFHPHTLTRPREPCHRVAVCQGRCRLRRAFRHLRQGWVGGALAARAAGPAEGVRKDRPEDSDRGGRRRRREHGGECSRQGPVWHE